MKRIFVVLLLTALLSACAPAPTPAPTATPIPTPTPTPTKTPVPTETPIPTPTETSQTYLLSLGLTGEEIIQIINNEKWGDYVRKYRMYPPAYFPDVQVGGRSAPIFLHNLRTGKIEKLTESNTSLLGLIEIQTRREYSLKEIKGITNGVLLGIREITLKGSDMKIFMADCLIQPTKEEPVIFTGIIGYSGGNLEGVSYQAINEVFEEANNNRGYYQLPVSGNPERIIETGTEKWFNNMEQVLGRIVSLQITYYESPPSTFGPGAKFIQERYFQKEGNIANAVFLKWLISSHGIDPNTISSHFANIPQQVPPFLPAEVKEISLEELQTFPFLGLKNIPNLSYPPITSLLNK